MKKKILGIDPGSSRIGYGVLEYENKKSNPEVVSYGYIDLESLKSDAKRLLHLHQDLKELITRYKPECVAIEGIYYFKNSKTITPVIQSKGVIIFTAAKENLNIYEYTPLQIKQTISGYGKAHKSFISKIIQSSLNISNDIKPDDASDALAIALCHYRHLISH